MAPIRTVTWLNLTVGLLFLLVGSGTIFLVNRTMKEHALLEAREKARIILDHNLATHHYFAQELKPAVFKLSDSHAPEGYFEPSWMSSTYAVRAIDVATRGLSDREYYYKECAINARTPANEADGYEAAFIRALNADPELVDRSVIRHIDDQPVFQVLRRGETMEEGCLRCHSTPDRAPAGLVAHYGAERSFGRRVGEVVSAISIRIPLAEAHANADRLSGQLSLVLVGVLAALFILQTLLGRVLLHAPLGRLEEHIAAMGAGGNPALLENPTGGREIRDLTAAYNRLIRENRAREAEVLEINQGLDRRVRERTAELEAANRELDAFAYSVSHDLRAPLRAIDGFSHILQEEYGGQMDERGHIYLTKVREGSHRMGELIDGLLTLSRATRGEMVRLPVNLSQIAQEVVAQLRAAEPDRRVEVRIAPDLKVRGDPRLIKALLGNLLGNAWKFTARRPEGALIQLDALHQDGETLFRIRDNGAGFDMQYADELFQPFRRLHPAQQFPGSGIGLATVQRIVHRHGGRIRAEGWVGEGAVFSFTLAPAGAGGESGDRDAANPEGD